MNVDTELYKPRTRVANLKEGSDVPNRLPAQTPEKAPQHRVNWSAVFVSYCSGASLEELADLYALPVEILSARASKENWKGLRLSLPLVSNPSTALVATDGHGRSAADLLPPAVKENVELVLANRRRNLAVFEELRDHVVEYVRKLKTGKLKLVKVFNSKSGPVEHIVDPGPGDWVNIAAYAKTIADGTYRALGDNLNSDKNPNADPATLSAPPAITIILPAAISQARAERNITPAPEVIDLRPEPVAVSPPAQ